MVLRYRSCFCLTHKLGQDPPPSSAQAQSETTQLWPQAPPTEAVYASPMETRHLHTPGGPVLAPAVGIPSPSPVSVLPFVLPTDAEHLSQVLGWN